MTTSSVITMNDEKVEDALPEREVKKCPVCKESTYSSNGIHPQCAMKQADEPRRLVIAAEKKLAKQSKQSD